MTLRPSRVAFFPLRCEVDPSGELEASRAFLNILRREPTSIEVVNLSQVGALSRGRISLLLGNLNRIAGMRAALRSSSCDLAIIKIPTPAQIAPLRPLLVDFKGPVVFWCDSLCFDFPPLGLGLRLLTREPLLTGARAFLNGRSWLRLGGPPGRWVVVATQVQRAQLVGLGWDPSFIRVIPNSSTLASADSLARPAAPSAANAALRMGYIGHLDSVKGVSDLVKSLQELRKGSTPFSFHFAVSPLSSREAIPKFDDPRIRISTAVDRVRYLSNLDLLALPYWANWGTNIIPTVLLEAMNLGVPVLTPDTALSREVLGDDYQGLYARNDGMALFRAIQNMLTDPGRRPSGLALRDRFAALYSPRKVEEAWLSFLHQTLA